MTVQPGLCLTWSEPQIVGFLMHRLNYTVAIKQTEAIIADLRLR